MYTGLMHSHSYLAYLVLIGLLISIVVALVGLSGSKPFTEKNRKLGLLGLIPAHLQGLVGIILYFVSPVGISNASGAAMKDYVSRYYFLEHPLMMILALILITVGYARSKRLRDDSSRHKAIVIFYGIAFVLILIRIPWFAWPG